MSQDGSETADQIQAREKREAGQARADAAANASREQVDAGESTVGEPVDQRSKPPAGRRSAKKSTAK